MSSAPQQQGELGTRYACHIWNEFSSAGSKLWQHAKQAHLNPLEITSTTEEANAKESFLDKVYVKCVGTKLHQTPFCGYIATM